MFVDDYKTYLAETRGSFLYTDDWGFCVYEFRNNFICICDLFVHWDCRGAGVTHQVLEMVTEIAREKKMEFIGFKLSANIHGFDRLTEIAEHLDFERITVQPEYILYLRRL